jgi:uncharacterized protein (DUF2384 family)
MATEQEVRQYLSHYFDPENMEKWLNFPHPDFGNRTPQSVIDEGLGQAIIDLIESVMNGDMT